MPHRFRPRLVVGGRVALATLVALAAVGVARAGHEITFYPSFYPQEITVKTVDRAAAARGLAKGELHAYVGDDPFPGSTPPDDVRYVESLGGLVTLRFEPAAASFREASARCSAAAQIRAALATSRAADFVPHAYPVTPFHPDWLAHYDLAEAVATPPTASTNSSGPLRVKAPARFAEALAAAGVSVVDSAADAVLEIAGTRALLDAASSPWAKEGWYQVARVYGAGAAPPGDAAPGGDVAKVLARRQTGGWASEAERVALERRLVTGLLDGCARVPIGYLVRREAYTAEYSNGIENVAWDSEAGLRSPIFLRTVKLKDFMWNGWLALGVADKPAAAWNPVAGFTDTPGRLIWSAIADPPELPSPYGRGGLPSRVEVRDVHTGVLEIPADALAPDRATGVLRPVGDGLTATAKVTYRVLFSKFHDGTKMAPADVLAPYAFAVRWAARDPDVERATADARDHLAAARLVRVESQIKDLGDLHLFYDVALVDVYLRGALAAADAARMAPPWSAVPWELRALMDEASGRGWAAFSEREARRRRVPWLDLARDGRIRARLAALAQELERRAWVPDALKSVVTTADARQRWAALRRFARDNGHYLLTNGPYRLRTIRADSVVLDVFRDFSYPVGVGAYDRWALPLRAWVSSIEETPHGLALNSDVESVQKFERSYKILRGPFRPEPAGEGFKPVAPVAHYVVLGADGQVKAAGTSDRLDGERLIVPLDGLEPGRYRVMLALTLADNLVKPEVKVVTWTRS